MKKSIYALMGIAIIFASSCKKNFDNVVKSGLSTTAALDTLKGVITTNRTVSTNAYLYGLVYVQAPAILTINPGVTVFGSQSTVVFPGPNVVSGVFDTVNLERNKGTLCIQKGAKLSAAGQLHNPIIWTSDDKIAVGSRHVGDWGGLILYGQATIHNAAGQASSRFEAFDQVPNRPENFYGGSNDADNSGTITYNRFEFGGGVVTAPGKEVNGVTMCGVGDGTTVNHVEVLKSGDDGIEFFGGAVNVKNFLTYASKDDDYDFDEGYHGSLQFIVAYRDTSADNSGSHLIEADNDASASNFAPYTRPIIANATLIGPHTRKDLCDGVSTTASYFDGALEIRRRVSVILLNSYVIGNEMPYDLMFTPTTGDGTGTGPVSALLSAPSATPVPANIQAFNIYQINSHPSDLGVAFQRAIVQTGLEGNPVPCGLLNDNTLITALTSSQNANNGLLAEADFHLGGTLENTSSTPFLHTGTNLVTAYGLPFFTGTNERGGVVTTDNWTLAGSSGAKPWISIVTQ